MKKENFASVRTFAILCLQDMNTEDRRVFENYHTSLNSHPWRLQEDKERYVFYNPTLDFLQEKRWMIAKINKFSFRKFEFVTLNLENFSYDVLSLEENPDWNDKEKICRTIPYPPKCIITKTIHMDTQATDLQDFYAKISAEMDIPIAKDAAQLTDIAFERAEKVHGEDPHKLLEHFFDKNIVGIERWRTMRKLYGGCLYFDSLEMKN
ncbi:MAG: hypothetical protein K5860_00890 [Bacteroidales bacterium]|nr:hypothetical protein [Bacteroidales bacterium]